MESAGPGYIVKMSRERNLLDQAELTTNVFFVCEYLMRWYSRTKP